MVLMTTSKKAALKSVMIMGRGGKAFPVLLL